MSDVSVLISKTPQDWLHVVSYKDKREGQLFFSRIISEKVLHGYFIVSLLESPAMVINHQINLDDLHITNNDIESVRIATAEEKKAVKNTLLEAMEIAVRRSNGLFIHYNQNARTYLEALPV
jgi:hypothetical protein